MTAILTNITITICHSIAILFFQSIAKLTIHVAIAIHTYAAACDIVFNLLCKNFLNINLKFEVAMHFDVLFIGEHHLYLVENILFGNQ
jgi:hypothetical protein